ncbi:hypothetical protein JOF41_005376 [Saccharothrix coeruleofusca]|uniref:RICIN domain-containing protein n=1 Tax=Saccharothrix coeruleofusca TaxID=33919 RepID=UPI001AEA7711|nr:RICIN domain-containing protein [Saccharothrix coeruleofusca]MBP2339198.1 hypothetical protein [Saccharothrix coeruleofusca]
MLLIKRALRALAVAALAALALTAPAAAEPDEVTALSGFEVINFAAGANGKCLDVWDAGRGPQIHMWGCNGWSNQDWTIDTGPNGGARLRPFSDLSKCLDSYRGRGNQVVQHSCDNTRTQEFTRVEVGSTGGIALRSFSNGLCLDIYDHGRGDVVMMWDCHYSDNQRWYWRGDL